MELFRATFCLFLLTWFTQSVYSGRLCSVRRSRAQSYIDRQRVSYRERYKTSCGAFGWRRCTRYRTRFRFVTMRKTRTVFETTQVCCSGWSGESCSIHNQAPSVTSCPSDLTVAATGRTTNVRWRQPRFKEPFDFRMTLSSTYPANRATLAWGSHRVTYTARSSNNGREVTCSFTVTVEPPLAHPRIDGQLQGSVVEAAVGVPLTLTCRVDCGKPPFHLGWVKRQIGTTISMQNDTRYRAELCGFRDYLNAVSVLTYHPRLEDDNTTLTCVDAMSTPSQPQHASVILHVSYTRHPDLLVCPANITTAASGEETNVSWPEPIFVESFGFQLNVTSTFGTNTTSLGWGEHRVEYTARNTYNNMETSCVFYIEITPPPDTPEIAGFNNGSTVSVHVGSAIILVCRADHGDSPYILTWTNGSHEIHEGTRYYTEPHDFRNLTNAVNELTFMPRLGDNNMTLTCVANKSEPERLEHVAVTLNVSYTILPTLEFCPSNQSFEATHGERVSVSWQEPEFSEPFDFRLNVTSTFDTNTTSLGWGEHRVQYTATNTYNNMETVCVFFLDIRPPLDEPVIVGHENNSILDVTVGTPITLTCRADYGDPPYLLTWTNRLELNDKTTAVTETTTTSATITDYTIKSNASEDIALEINATSPMDTSTSHNTYFPGSTTESTSEHNPVFGNETSLQNSNENTSINVTGREVETIWPNRTRANTTVWANKQHRIAVRSLNETGTRYQTTASVESSETTTEMVYNTSEWTDHTDSQYENNVSHTRVKMTTDATLTTDYDDIVSTTERPTYSPEEEPFQVVNSLPGSRYDTEPSGYRQTQNATNRLTFVPRLEDDKTTLYCAATRDGRRLLIAVLLNVTGVPDSTSRTEPTGSVLPTDSTGTVHPTGFVHEAGPSTEEGAAGWNYTWLVIAASSIGAITLLGAIAAMVYFRRQKRGQLLLDDHCGHTNVNENGHNFKNPAYENVD